MLHKRGDYVLPYLFDVSPLLMYFFNTLIFNLHYPFTTNCLFELHHKTSSY